MKKVVLLVMGLLLLLPSVSGYLVNIDAPDTLTVGKPLVVTGTTTFPIGMYIDVVLYYQLTTTTEIKRNIVNVLPDKTFKTVFDTTGLKTGTYKVEVPVSGGGDSVTMRVIQLVDRADEIYLASSSTQPFTGKMYIAGTIAGSRDSGIQVEVFGPDGLAVFGPSYINTNYAGDFSVDVPVNKTGIYEVSFTDARGYIGTKTISVVGMSVPPESLTPAVTAIKTPLAATREPAETQQTPVTPLPGLAALGVVALFLSKKIR